MSSQAGDKAGILFDGNGDFLFVMGALAEDGGDSSLYVVHQRKVEGGDDGGIILMKLPRKCLSRQDPVCVKVSSIQQVGATLKNIKIGKDGSVAGKNFGGVIHEVMVFSKKLSVSDHKKVEGYSSPR